MTEKEIQKLLKKRKAYLDALNEWSDKEMKRMQKKLLTFVEDYLRAFDSEGGTLKLSKANMAMVNQMDAVFEKFRTKYMNNYLVELGDRMLGVQIFAYKYFKSIDDKLNLDRIKKQLTWLNERIGVKDGKIIKGSFLDSLATDTAIRTDIKTYVTGTLGNTNFSAKEVRQGLSKIVTGTKEVGGTIERNIRKYVVDTTFQVDAAVDQVIAQDIGLEYFVYHGTIIDTTREFCKARVNQVFHVDDTRDWYDDPNLPKAKGENRESYNPVVDRGRWNCRHYIRWISDARAEELGYTLRKK